MNDAKINSALNSIRTARRSLKEEGIIRHEKALHCELAEWLIAEYLEGKRATSGNQKGWDIELPDGRKIQVKSHAKADTNPSNWTTLSKHRQGVSEIFIVLFSVDYFIMEIFQIETGLAYTIANELELSWKKLRTAEKSMLLDVIKAKFPFLFK